MRRETRARSLRVSPSLLVLIGSVGLLCLPLLLHGPLPLGSDIYSTLHYSAEFSRAFFEGDWYPRWTERTNQDLGAPSFVFLQPFAYYCVTLASWLAGSPIPAMKLYLVLLAAATFLAFYRLASHWFGPGLPAALASAAYLLLPYHVLDMYQRFALSETTAFLFFPLILLFARRCFLVGRLPDFCGLALSYGGLIYTHIVSALSFSLFLGAWLLWETRGSWRRLVRPVAALLCGLAIASPVLLPAVTERAHANIDWVKQMPNGDFRVNFIFKDDVLPGLGIKDPVKPPVLKSAHSQLLLAALAAGLALAWSGADQGRRRRDIVFLALACGACYFMQTRLSTPVWLVIPELSTIQFPWRLQTIMVLTTALLLGYALSAGWGRAGGSLAASRSMLSPAAAGIAGLVVVNLALAWQNAHLKSFTYDDQVNARPGVVHWMEPAFTPVEFTAYKRFKMMTIRMPRAAFVTGSGEVRVERWLSSRILLDVSTSGGGTVNLRSFWFPGWEATLDGAPLPLSVRGPNATLSFECPPGDHRVELRFGRTPMRSAAALAGIAGLLALPGAGWLLRPIREEP